MSCSLTILGRALAHRADRIDARITALERGQADHGRTLARIEGYLDRTRQRSHR